MPKKMEVKIYQPGNKHKSIGEMIKEMFNDFKSAKTLGFQLFKRDVKAEYSQSLLGIFWSIAKPAFSAIVWIFLNASGAVTIPDSGMPYPIFVILGTAFWSLFINSVNSPLKESNAAKGILSKVNFPKEAILISSFYKVVFNLLINLVLITGILIYFGISINYYILLFPLAAFLVILFGFSFGVILTPVGMLYTDVGRVIPLFLSLVMYLTPVVFPKTKWAVFNQFMQYNPLTPLINSCRNTLTGAPLDNIPYLIIITFISLFFLIMGWLFYRISIPILVERM